MDKSEFNFLKKFTLFVMLFFIISIISFIFIYSGFDINNDVKNKFSQTKLIIIKYDLDLISQKKKKEELENLYAKSFREYNILLEQQKTQALNANSTISKISNTKLEISQRKKKISQLNLNIEKYKIRLGQ